MPRSLPTPADLSQPTVSTAGWDERALLLLGVLMDQSQHGYQINDFIERRLARVYPMKKPTAYALLDRLESAGAIAVHAEQAGNRPPRKVYTLTDAGRDLFRALLVENLRAVDETTSAGDVGLIFLTRLEPDIALEALHARLAGIEEALAEIPSPPFANHHDHLRLDLAFDRARHLREAERAWLQDTIARLESGSPAESGSRITIEPFTSR
ncbi:MAG: PadR family transcriptional regulator [Thermomicrobiales bacterium]